MGPGLTCYTTGIIVMFGEDVVSDLKVLDLKMTYLLWLFFVCVQREDEWV